MTTPRKDDLAAAAATMGRKGGQAKSERKTAANRAKAVKRWAKAKSIQAPVESADSMEAQRAELLDVMLSPKPLVKRKEPPHDD